MLYEEKVRLLLEVVQEIFTSKLANTDITQVTIITNTNVFAGRTFVNGKLRGFDFTVQDENGLIPLRVIEQNPDKQDDYGNLKQNAVLARAGHQIAWVIHRGVNRFLGKIQDGKWTKSTPRATTPVNNNTGAVTPVTAKDQYDGEYQHYDNSDLNGDWQRELPDINVNEIPIYVTGV